MSDPYLLIFIIAGLMVGSFLNVCIYRLPLELSLVKPRSSCPHCQTQIKFYHNIPVLSFIMLKGHCAYCDAKISVRYPMVELISTILTGGLYLHFGLTGSFLFYLYLTYFLIVIAFIDLDTHLILNKALVVLFTGGLVLNFLYTVIEWPNALLGLVIGGGVLYLVALLGQWYFKKESVGMGDVKFAATLGFFVGWKMILISLYTGYLFAAIYFIFLKFLKKQPNKEYIPMGPFFSMAVFIWIIWWRELLGFYFSIIQ